MLRPQSSQINNLNLLMCLIAVPPGDAGSSVRLRLTLRCLRLFQLRRPRFHFFLDVLEAALSLAVGFSIWKGGAPTSTSDPEP